MIFVTPMDGSLIIMEGILFIEIFVPPMDGRLVIMKGSVLLFLLL